jgi:arylsulfatase A-like enzyme
VLVRRAYAPMPTTAPSMATAVTSKEPRSHGLLANGQGLAPEQLTAAEILRDAGYTTAGFASSVALEPDGISQGFELYVDSWGDDEESKPPAYGLPDVHPSPSRRGEYTTAAALDWFAHRDRERPFFAFVHYYDPHEPYARPEAERAPFVGDRDPDDKFDALRIGYDAEVAYADRELAKLVGGLERAGELDDTLIVIWSDHGQGLYDHGWPGHDMQLYEESMHVPLILVWPGEIPAGRVLEAPVELQDLLPTVLGLIGLPVPEDAAFEGRDLTRAVLGIGRADDEHTLFFQRRPVSQSRKILGVLHDGPMWAVQVGRWK